jgi:hypothetical protein
MILLEDLRQLVLEFGGLQNLDLALGLLLEWSCFPWMVANTEL